ncbi:MAG TPA: SurA N-terminal domain-containing protein [Spirochaetota bacterium]|nr:SurA N-terminal domain-containing protein [Spirochaetota bacterium]HOM38468.1 SurA N-terminal domain-containing protein [Spirochaetota bacterium]HPQ49008.1 SurA N-terminal domain-containing protein [Spirochaetota bacterium]
MSSFVKKVLPFLLVVVLINFCKGENNDWVARIGDDVITLREFNTKFDILLKLNFTSGQLALLKENPDVKRQILNTIISQRMILKEMGKLSIGSTEIRVLELQALAQYFIYKNVIPQVDIPSDDFLKSKYEDKNIKSLLESKGIKNFEEAKEILVREYQQARYLMLLRNSLEKLKYKYKVKVNDEFDENGINNYISDKIKQEDYSKVWLINIEDKVYYAKDIEDMIKTNILLTGSEEALKEYEKSTNKANVRGNMLNEIIGVLLVKTDAEKEGWINDQETKDFISVFIDNAKTQIYINNKIAKSIPKPDEKAALEYFNKNKDKIKKSFNEVKDAIIYNLWIEDVKLKAAKYIDKLVSEAKIDINDKYFNKKDEPKDQNK